MILRRLILLAAMVGALAVSAVTVLSAALFALHALFERWLGSAGAWAVIFGLFALVLGAAALVARSMARKKGRMKPGAGPDVTIMDLVDRFAEMVRDKPVAAVSAAVGAGVLAVRDPGRLASAVRRFAAGEDLR